MSEQKQKLKAKAPRMIALAIAAALVAVVVLEILQDYFVEGEPLTSQPVISTIITFTQNAVSTVRSWGYAGIFTLMLLESSSLPIPSEVVLPFAGYLVSAGQLNFWVTVTVATAAGIAGSLIDYYIGYKGVNYLSKHRFLGKVMFTKNQLEVAARWFGKYGPYTVFLSRLVPGFRTIASFPAGAVRMPLAKFIAFTTAGCLVWNALLIYVGVFLGTRWREVAGISHYLIIVAAVGVAAILVVWLLRRRRSKANV